MSEENQAPAQQVNLQKIYVKDVSFETPNSPQIFSKDWQPDVSIDLATNGQPIEGELYECVLTITVTAQSGGETAFLAEVHQAGIFEIRGFPDEQLAPILGIFCPTTLFPYVREAITELVSKGGFPQLLLAPVNFEAIYAQSQAEQTETH